MEPLDEYTSVAIDAAQEAGQILLDWAEKGFTVEFKGVMNLVTDADRAAEQAIVKRILSAFPDHQILAEEGGASSGSASRYKWVIDPLDGTTGQEFLGLEEEDDGTRQIFKTFVKKIKT